MIMWEWLGLIVALLLGFACAAGYFVPQRNEARTEAAALNNLLDQLGLSVTDVEYVPHASGSDTPIHDSVSVELPPSWPYDEDELPPPPSWLTEAELQDRPNQQGWGRR
jgi:hypothetical protein